jgi:hypothetical protein
MKVRLTAAIGMAMALAGCAPDAVRNSSPFDAWVNQLKSQCQFQAIGPVDVGQLLGAMNQLPNDAFLDATSRLYFGRISPAGWTDIVTAQLNGRPSDPGVQCVLARLPARP